MVFCGLLTERFSRPPETWQHVTHGMTREEIHSKLGFPHPGESSTATNDATWRKSRLYGQWELRVTFDHDKAAVIDEQLEWFWQ